MDAYMLAGRSPYTNILTLHTLPHTHAWQFHSMALVRSVLRDLADLLCIQNVPGPANPVTTL